MNSSPRYFLFDLGGTLMRSRSDWAPVLAQADRSLAETLRSYRIELDTQVFRARLRQYYEQRDKDCQETTYHFVLRELLRELGYPEIPESVLRFALNSLYAVTQKNWALEDDALQALQNLRAQNQHLGIFSNAGDDQDVQQLVEGFGIRAYFDFVLTSAASYYRKPHPRAFEIALAQWNATPQEAFMVGDSLQADIEGAKKLGLGTIWITRRAAFTPEEKARVQPDVEISALGELIPALEKIHVR
jgi:2-haloalkanoic acid dehalogenase type II